MSPDAEAKCISNDLDSLVQRIEALAAHADYTTALTCVIAAKEAIDRGRIDIHHRTMCGEWGP